MCNLNSSAPQHTCCCGSIHVKTGTLVIAILAAIGLVLNLISGTTSGYTANVSSSIVGFIIGVIVVACMFYGVHIERAGFLLPYLVFQVLGIIVSFLGVIICIIALASSSQFAHDIINGTLHFASNIGDSNTKVFAGVLIFAFLIEIAVQIWFFWVVYKCYVYFREHCC